MTRSPSMFSPSYLADAPPASWLGAFYGFLSAVVLALVTWFLQRLSTRDVNVATEQRRQREGEASVEVENIRSLQDLQRQRSADNDLLRREIADVRAHGDRRCETLERKLGILTTAYYQLHSVTVLLQQGWRTMRSRLKRTDPQFDETEFPELNIEQLDPLKLFAQMDRSTSITVLSSPSDPKKTTTIITEKPHDES